MSRRETWQEEYDRCMARALELRAEGNDFEADNYVRQARYAQMDGEILSGAGMALQPRPECNCDWRCNCQGECEGSCPNCDEEDLEAIR